MKHFYTILPNYHNLSSEFVENLDNENRNAHLFTTYTRMENNNFSGARLYIYLNLVGLRIYLRIEDFFVWIGKWKDMGHM